MGIFANKNIDPITGLQKEIKDYQKIATKAGVSLPQSPTEQPKKSLLAKVGSFVSSFETAPVVDAYLKGEDPLSAYTTSVKKGLSGKEDIATKKSYIDILEDVGWKSSAGTGKLTESATWKNFAKEIVGLGLDVALDPTSWLTGGTSGVVKVETKAGTKILSKEGVKVMQQIVKEETPKIAETLAKKGITIAQEDATKAAVKKAQRTLAKSVDTKMFDQGGIKFAGKTLVSGDTLAKPFTKTAEVIGKSETGAKVLEGINTITDSIGKTFNRDFNLPEKYVGLKQNFLDIFKNDADEIVQDLTKTFKNTSVADREAISKAVEANDFSQLSEYTAKLAEDTKKIFERVAKIEQERGLLNHTLDDYITHIYGDHKKAKQILDFTKMSGVRGGSTKYNKERVIPTIEEAEKLGLKPEKDVAKILAARLIASQKAIREQDLLRQIAGNFGVSRKQLAKEAEEIGVKDSPLTNLGKFFGKQKGNIKEPVMVSKRMLDEDLVEYTNKEFKGLMIPRVIAEDLEKIGKQVFNNEELKKFLRGYDAIQNFFKGSVTSIFPAFHGRNFLSNVAQNFLDIGVKALDPVSNLRAINILRESSKGVFTDVFGRTFNYADLRKIMKEKGVLGSPGARDVAETVEQKLSTGMKQKIDTEFKRFFSSESAPFRAGRAVGNVIESHARTINFLTNLERGMSFDEAAKRTKEFLFDYDNLSQFEKTVMRRAIPFYTWTRKNLELQAKMLIKKPVIISTELKTQRLGENETPEERQNLPEYLAEGLAIKVGNKNGLAQYLTGMGLPIENALQILPQGLSLDEIVDYLNKIASQGAFVPKFIAELATGHDFFRNKPLKDVYTGNEYASFPEFVKDFLKLKEKKVDYIDKNGKKVKYSQWIGDPVRLHLLRSLPTSRFSSTIGNITDKDITTTGKLLKNTTGIKIYPVDVQKMEEKELKQYIREIEDTLTNYGVTAQFTATYVPKEKKEEKKLNLAK